MDADGSRVQLRRVPTADLSASEIEAIRALLFAAFASDDEDERFTEDDWQHALGGTHVVVELDGEIVSHASVVERVLHVDGRPIRTGYVEAVATAPERQRMGLGTRVMHDVAGYVRERFELGALGTGSQGFYERLGWRIWQGLTSVRTSTGTVPTPEEDGYIMVLLTPSSPTVDLTAPISCEWRAGDVW